MVVVSKPILVFSVWSCVTLSSHMIFNIANHRCCICHALLDSHTSCFIKEENIFCKLDYNK